MAETKSKKNTRPKQTVNEKPDEMTMPGSMDLPDPAVLAQLAARNPMNQGMQRNMIRQDIPVSAGMESGALPMEPTTGPIFPEGTGGGNEAPLEDGRLPEDLRGGGSTITKEMLQKATDTLHRYHAGKASVEQRIIAAQEWWKLRNWEQIEAEKNIKGSHTSKSNTAWLWNCIVGKHADAMDAYPEPAILPRMPDDKDTARLLSDIVPVVMKLNGFEKVYNDVMWQKMLEGTGAYGVFWSKDEMNGLGDVKITKANVLNLYWEPGINELQDSTHLFYVSMEDNEKLTQMYPQLVGRNLGSSEMVAQYRYDDNVDTSNKSLVIDWYYHEYQGMRKILHYVKYVGEHVLYATKDDPEYADRGLYDDGKYPFVLDPLYPVEGSPCGFGYIHVGKDTQKDIDLLSQAVVTNAAINATPRYMMRKDGGLNEQEFMDITRPIVHFTGDLDPNTCFPIQNPSLPGNVLDVMNLKVDELKFVTGNMDVNNGGAPSGVTAASAIAALQEHSGRSSKDSNKASYRAYAEIVTMVIERIRQFYEMPRMFRITGAMGQEDFVSFNNSGLLPQPQGVDFGVDMGFRLPAFDIDVRAQRETSYTKAAQNELAIQLYNLGLFNPQMADQAVMALEMMDFKGKEEITQKIAQKGTMAMALQQIADIAAQMALQAGDQQSAAMIQQIAAVAAGGGTAALPGMTAAFQMPQGESTQGGIKGQEHPFVERARQNSEEATRPA